MSLYGNIYDTANVHFQFDKIFSNRRDMDAAVAAGSDGIFAGRFVLVKYELGSQLTFGHVLQGYYHNNRMYATYNGGTYSNEYTYTTFTQVQNPTAANWNKYYYVVSAENGQIPYVFKLQSQDDFIPGYGYFVVAGDNITNPVTTNFVVQKVETTGELTQIFYRCTGASSGVATWEQVNLSQDYQDYFINFNIDALAYAGNFDSRGYDSTVWEKVFSEGKGKFVQVARLSVSSPRIELFPAPPSDNPVVPYLDALSTDSYYRIHVPTGWGFRFKEAGQSDKSDQNVIQPYYTFTNNEITGTQNREIRADIYFNKDGFNRATRTYDNNTPNEILLQPTGASGKVYYNEDGTTTTLDTKELSIHFPAAGNLISDIYDLTYSTDRKLDTAWYEPDDSRKNAGDPYLNGKTFDLNTIAGTVNTFHNRLGQVVKNISNKPSLDTIATYDKNTIYYVSNESKYYRIGKNYSYTSLGDSNISYTNVGHISEAQYEPNTYYINLNGSYVVANNAYSTYGSGVNFFEKNIAFQRYTQVNLTIYQQNRYWYKAGNDYIQDSNANAPTYITQTYYKSTTATPAGNLTQQYVAGGYYIKDNQDNYLRYTELIPDVNNTYYSQQSVSSQSNAVVYQPGKYYYFVSGKPYLDSNNLMNNTYIYYYIPLKDTLISVQDPDNPNNVIYAYELDVDNRVQVTLIQPGGDVNYYIQDTDGNYINVKNLDDLTTAHTIYYNLIMNNINANSFYIPNLYYTKVGNNYYLSNEYASNTTYYRITNVQVIDYPFYEQNKYWYNNGTTYQLDDNINGTQGRTYYIATPLYVYNDTSGRFPMGYEWNEYALFVPASVTLATREEYDDFIPIEGIDNGASSVNGSILTFQNLINSGDDHTRDTANVQGALNHLTDILAAIRRVIPGRVVYVDDFGQLASSDVTYAQLLNLVNS